MPQRRPERADAGDRARGHRSAGRAVYGEQRDAAGDADAAELPIEGCRRKQHSERGQKRGLDVQGPMLAGMAIVAPDVTPVTALYVCRSGACTWRVAAERGMRCSQPAFIYSAADCPYLALEVNL